jgi:hypothetical protein
MRRIAQSPAIVESTLGDLDAWAKRARALVSRPEE